MLVPPWAKPIAVHREAHAPRQRSLNGELLLVARRVSSLREPNPNRDDIFTCALPWWLGAPR